MTRKTSRPSCVIRCKAQPKMQVSDKTFHKTYLKDLVRAQRNVLDTADIYRKSVQVVILQRDGQTPSWRTTEWRKTTEPLPVCFLRS